MSETQICVHYDLPTDDVMLLYLIQKPGDATKLSCLLLSGFHVIYLYISFFVITVYFNLMEIYYKTDKKTNRLNIF